MKIEQLKTNTKHSQIQLRPFQAQALQALKEQSHVILNAPTGSGKTLIFQRYILENPRLKTVLVVPLNALARQHHQGFKELSVPCTIGVAGGEDPPLGQGVWITNPETLLHRRKWKEWSPDFWVFDEAHTFWEWQHFRPSFGHLLDYFKSNRISKSFWCSATLNRASLAQVQSVLNPKAQVLGRFSVPGHLCLKSEFVPMVERAERLARELHFGFELWGENSLQVVFVSTRTMAEKLNTFLDRSGFQSIYYHAGMALEEKQALEKKIHSWTNGIIVATSAFGMGMNFKHVRKVVCFQPPHSLMSLAQFVGRAGRSGEGSEAIVFWDSDDFNRLSWVARGCSANGQEGDRSALVQLDRVREWCQSAKSANSNLEVYFQGY